MEEQIKYYDRRAKEYEKIYEKEELLDLISEYADYVDFIELDYYWMLKFVKK